MPSVWESVKLIIGEGTFPRIQFLFAKGNVFQAPQQEKGLVFNVVNAAPLRVEPFARIDNLLRKDPVAFSFLFLFKWFQVLLVNLFRQFALIRVRLLKYNFGEEIMILNEIPADESPHESAESSVVPVVICGPEPRVQKNYLFNAMWIGNGVGKAYWSSPVIHHQRYVL